MNYFDIYIYLILAIKLCFILMSIIHLYFKIKGKKDSELDKQILYWKERFEFIFILLMSLLLIYLFNPIKQNQEKINGETKILLYLFGFVLLITADWNIFIHESPWFQQFQSIIGKNLNLG